MKKITPCIAHSWFLVQIIPILESLVPVRRESGGSGGRSKPHRRRQLLWRKLGKVRKKLEYAISVQKIARLLHDKQELEIELKTMYSSMTQEAEAKVISGMKENVNVSSHMQKPDRKLRSR